MTLDKARELLSAQAGTGSAYTRNGAGLVLNEVAREHGQQAADRLIRELDLERVFGFHPGEKVVL